MSTEHTGKKGHLTIFIEGNNIKITYTVEREKERRSRKVLLELLLEELSEELSADF